MSIYKKKVLTFYISRHHSLCYLPLQRIRDCSHMHKHNGTTAAIMLMNQHELRELHTKELYFDQHFPIRKGKFLNEDKDQVLPW